MPSNIINETKTPETTIVVDDIFAAPEGAAAPVLPTAADLKGKGWSSKEIESAEKNGMVAEKSSEKVPAKVEEKAAPAAKPETAEPPKPRGALPNFEMTPDQEKVFFETFGAGTAPRAMYVGMKAERRRAQAAEAKARELEIRLQTLETVVKAPSAEETLGFDPEDQPLTLKQLREMQKAEFEASQRQLEANTSRSAVVVQAQNEQEEYARSVLPDFDATVELAKEVIKDMDAQVPERWKQARAVKLFNDLRQAAAEADKFDLNDHNAAFIAYELGQMHPQYGKTGTPEKVSPKVDGNLNPEQMKRLEKNTQLRSASAAIPAGSGRRTISVDEVDLKTLNGMPPAKLAEFRQKHPEQYSRLVRG